MNVSKRSSSDRECRRRSITEALQDEIAAQDCDGPTRKRLSACLPMLEQAIANWQANHAFSAPGLMIAAATSHSGVVVHVNAWSSLACDPDLAAFALAEAVEMPTSAESARRVTMTLGERERAELEAAEARVRHLKKIC